MFKTKFDRTPTKGVEFKIPSMVQQSDKESADINNIIKTYCECGVCPSCNVKQPLSDDLAAMSSVDFTTMMQQMAAINNEFNELPAEVRKKFGHNPANMLEFVQDPNNREEAEKLGLISKSNISSDISVGVPVSPVVPEPSTMVNQNTNQTVQTTVIDNLSE